jgi:cytochrome c biogenesis protein CcmG/thiol:disulfide interchange protein DsbE
MRRALLPALAVLIVAGLIVYEVSTSGSGTTGRPAPPLPSAVLQPPKIDLAALRGKPALINFWASWCEPCKEEAPELERFARGLSGRANVVGVDYTDESQAASKFLRHYGWSFPVLSDPDGIYGARYKFTGLPATVVLDAQGRIVTTLRGPQSAADLRRALRAAESA